MARPDEGLLQSKTTPVLASGVVKSELDQAIELSIVATRGSQATIGRWRPERRSKVRGLPPSSSTCEVLADLRE